MVRYQRENLQQGKENAAGADHHSEPAPPSDGW